METPVITDTVSHYTVLKKLGAGGGGEVCLAADKPLNRKVAIKFLPGDSAADQQEKRDLIREAPAAVRLDHHPNICTIHEVGEEAGRSFIVMQNAEGEIQSVLYTAKRLRPEAQGCLDPGSGYFESNNPERVATDATALRLNQLSIDPPRVAAAATLGWKAQPLRGKEFKIRSGPNKPVLLSSCRQWIREGIGDGYEA